MEEDESDLAKGRRSHFHKGSEEKSSFVFSPTSAPLDHLKVS